MFLLVLAAALEVIGTEIMIRLPLQDEVDGGEDRGSDGHDRIPGIASRPDVVELSAQVGVLLVHRRPSALHQRGLEPRGTIVQAIGTTPLALPRHPDSLHQESWHHPHSISQSSVSR
jgi:hypothetical protein